MDQSNPQWSPKGIAKALCEQWGWRDQRGRLKDFAARTFLMKLEGGGEIELPPLQENKRRKPKGVVQPESWEERKSFLHQVANNTRRLEQVLKKAQNESLEADPVIAREVQYFRNHADPIHYQDLHQDGAPIGSGAVESLCGQLQKRRPVLESIWLDPSPGVDNHL